jgi:hypothetical protein
MHPVINSHVQAFNDQFQLNDLDESKVFEAFVNYCVASQHYYGDIDPVAHIYHDDDPGIDGVIFKIDEEIVTSVDEADTILGRQKRNMDVNIFFVQSKTSENWKKSEVNVFESAIIDFINLDSQYPHGTYLAERKQIFKKIINNIGKIKNGKPDFFAYFATTGPINLSREIKGAFGALKNSVSKTEYFNNVSTFPLGRDDLIKLCVKLISPVVVHLPTLSIANFIQIDGVKECYIVIVDAKEFINKVLRDENGNLRKGIFEENVREFLGPETPVNQRIAETLKNQTTQKRFGLLNNGVTIIAPDIRLSSGQLFMKDFQIVNGCQTSNVLFEHGDAVNDATLTIKVIKTEHSEIIDDVIKSTNSQTQV